MTIASKNRCDLAIERPGRKPIRCANEATEWLVIPFAGMPLPVATCLVHRQLITGESIGKTILRLGPDRRKEYEADGFVLPVEKK